MRKILSVVLALTLVIGSFSFVFAAPNDVAGTKYEDAVEELMTLGIVDGYGDGTIRPNQTIKREEFAKLIVVALGLEDLVAFANDTTQFTDVPENSWAKGYINIAAGQGLVKGRGDGTFGYGDNITYGEVITIILRALGYDDSLPGQWPYDYIVKAKDLGVTDDVTVSTGAAIRGDVFLLVDNSLRVPMVEKNEDGVFVEKEDDTLLAKVGFDKITGVMTARVNDDNEITLVDADGKEHVVIVPENFDSEANFGLELTVWVNGDDEVELYEVKDTPLLDAVVMDGEKVKLVDADKKYEVADNAIIYVDGEEVDKPEVVDYAKVVLNDDDEVVFFDGYNWSKSLIVEDVDDNVLFGTDENSIDIELDIEEYTIVKDGKTISINDIEEGDVFFYNKSLEYAEVYNNTVRGEIENIFKSDVEVDGTLYDYTVDVTYEKANGDIDIINDDALTAMQDAEEPVTLYLTRDGSLRHVVGELEEEVTSTVAGYLTDDLESYEYRNDYYLAIEVLDQNGNEVTYDVNVADVDVDVIQEWAETTDTTTIDTDASTAGVQSLTSTNKTKWADYSSTDKLAIKDYYMASEWVDVSDGNVIELTFDEDGDITDVTLNVDTKDTYTYVSNANDIKIEVGDRYIDIDSDGSNKRLTDDTVVFYVEDSANLVATTWGEVEEFELLEGADVYYDGGYVTYLVVNTTSNKVEETTYVGILTQVRRNSDDEITRIKILVDGEEETYYVDTDKFTSTSTAFAAGKVAEITVDDNSGKITNMVDQGSSNLVVAESAVDSVVLKDREITVASSVYDYELVNSAIVYDVTDAADITEIDLIDIEAGTGKDKVVLVLDEEDSVFVKYVLLTYDASEGSGSGSYDELDADVTYQATVKAINLFDNTVTFDKATVVKASDNSSLTLSDDPVLTVNENTKFYDSNSNNELTTGTALFSKIAANDVLEFRIDAHGNLTIIVR